MKAFLSKMLRELLSIFADIRYMASAKGEDALANTVATRLRDLSLDGKLNCIWFHIANEYVVANNLDMARIKRRQCMGMIAGAPDYVLINEYRSLFIELKADSGRLSDKQKLFHKWAGSVNVPVVIAKSWEGVRAALEQYEFIKK